MRPSSVRIAAAVNGLITLVQGALPTSVTVVDGPKPTHAGDVGKEVVLVGWDPMAQYHAVERRVEAEADMCGRTTAVGEIACYIATASGVGDMAQARGRAVELVELIEAAVRADGRLGGAVDEAWLGPDAALSQFQTGDDGASAGLPFSVAYRAYI